jgi:PAS domain S-box-containing protein
VPSPDPVQRFFGLLGEHAPIGLAAFDRDLKLLAINDWLARASGRPADDIVGRSLDEIDPDASDVVASVIAQVFATEMAVTEIELVGRGRARNTPSSESSWFPIWDDGIVIAVGCVVAETTERKRVQQRIGTLQAALNAVSNASDPRAAVRHIVEHALHAVGAQGAAVGFATPDEEFLDVAEVAGPLGQTLLEHYPRLPTTAHAPACVAYRERRTVWVPTRAEWERDYPEGSNLVQDGGRAALAVPLQTPAGRARGVLGLLWDHEPALTDDDLALVAAFAQQATGVFYRIVLLDRERRSRERFELLAALGARLDEAPGVAARVEAFCDVVVPAFADFAFVELEDGDRMQLHVRHREPRFERALRRLRDMRRSLPAGHRSSLSSVIATGRAQLMGRPREAPGFTEAEAELVDELDITSVVLVPIMSRNAIAGGAGLGTCRDRTPFGDDDITFATELGRRLAIALDTARVYERERRIAETLQHSLLPERVPVVPGLRCWARYIPGTDLDVGGDFWDVIPMGGGRTLLAVGDVAGRGERAAITMGRLRTVLRATATRESSPAALLRALNRFLFDEDEDMATCICAVLNSPQRSITVASAGHPPVLRVSGAGEAFWIETPPGVPLGVRTNAAYEEQTVPVEPADTLVAFTDGLVEQRGVRLDDRLDELAAVTCEVMGHGDAWCDAILDRMLDGTRGDDVALLGVRLDAAFDRLSIRVPAEPQRLRAVRDELRAWLAANEVDLVAAERLTLALGESVANVTMHAYGPGGGELRVHGIVEEDAVRVRVEDDGCWRPSRGDVGYGLRVMRALVDDARVETSDAGTCVELVVRVGADRAT